MTRKAQSKGPGHPGWHKDNKRHSIAAKMGWMNRRVSPEKPFLTPNEVKGIHEHPVSEKKRGEDPAYHPKYDKPTLAIEVAKFYDRYHGYKDYAEIKYQNQRTRRWIETWTHSPTLDEERDLGKDAFVRQADGGTYVETSYFVRGGGRSFEIQRASFGSPNFLIMDITDMD